MFHLSPEGRRGEEDRVRLRALLRKQLHRIGNGLGLRVLDEQVSEAKMLAARVLINQLKGRGVVSSIKEAEFKVFSQFGDDGIIQYLIHHLAVPQELRVFIEFGVENYEEANTRFLLMNDNWRGLIMDSDPDNMAYVRTSSYYWKHDLTAVAAFIDRENVNELFRGQGFTGEIGLLSIDIDGNDYWVWDRIEAVNPIIVVVEYNSVFGARHAVTIPYNPSFSRNQAHHSNLYWGSSLKALYILAQRKGYAFVGCNSAGNNAYFIRRDKLEPLKELTTEEGYVESRFRESRSLSGELTFLKGLERLSEIRKMEVFDIEKNRVVKIADL
jgi:hypothetical protein